MYIDFAPLETDFVVELVVGWLLFLGLNLPQYFSSWNLLYDDLIFRETYFFMIFFFVKLLACWFFLVDFFFVEHNVSWFFVYETCCIWIISSGNLLYPGLCLPETSYIFISSSENLLNVDFSLRETCTFIFLLLKLFLLVERVAWWLLFFKLSLS